MYVRTWLGKLWIPLRPVLDVGTRVLIFGGLLGVPSEGVPYAVFFVVGMTVWVLFASSLYWMTRSVELNRRFLKRMYVPRLTLLAAAIFPSGLWFVLYAAIAVIVLGYFAIVDGTLYLVASPALLLPVAGLCLIVALALAIGLWTSVYGAQARDVRFGLSYVLNVWIFLTPVLYPLSIVPDKYRTLAELNPMTAPVEMVRFGLFGTGGVPLLGLGATVATIAILGGFGLWFFIRSEAAALDNL